MAFDTKIGYTKKYISGGKKQDDEIKLKDITNTVSNLITYKKSSYFANLGERLNDPLTGPKTYWSILKRFMNKVKIPIVPPLLVNDNFVTDFKEKAGIFNVFFAEQCNNILMNRPGGRKDLCFYSCYLSVVLIQFIFVKHDFAAFSVKNSIF